MGYITQEGLDNLRKYKYVSGGYTYFDKLMNHWWEFVVKLLPMVSWLPTFLTILVVNGS
jgi:hypothetical protein